MTIEQRIRVSANRIAGAIEPHAPDMELIRSRARQTRKHRQSAAAAAVVVVVASAVGLRVLLGPSPAAVEPAPSPDTPVAPAITASKPVWHDANGLHLGDQVFESAAPEPTDCDVPEGCSSLSSLALTQDGVVYGAVESGKVWYQQWNGSPQLIGEGSAMGPAADPTGSTAAWFEGSDLVMFDTATGQELARADQSTTMPSAPGTRSRSGNRILEVTGNLILDVTPDRVYWWGEVLYRFDLTTGKTTTVSPQATNVSTLDYADVRSCCIAPFAVTSDEVTSTISPSSAIMHTFEVGELVQPLFFNADGSYLAALNVDGDELRAAVANVMTDEIFYPSPQHSYPSIGWGYGNTLMVYEATGRRDEQLLACDVSNQSCQPMEHTGPVMLPSS